MTRFERSTKLKLALVRIELFLCDEEDASGAPAPVVSWPRLGPPSVLLFLAKVSAMSFEADCWDLAPPLEPWNVEAAPRALLPRERPLGTPLAEAAAADKPAGLEPLSFD